MPIQHVRSLAQPQTVSFVGILTNFAPLRQTKGDDWIADFYVQDAEFNIDPQYSSSSIRCKIFRRDRSRLPSGWTVGDPVLVRNIQVKPYNKTTEGVSPSRDSAAVLFFPQGPELRAALANGGASKLPFKGSELAPPTPQERAAVVNVKRAHLNFGGEKSGAARAPIIMPSRDRRRLLKDISVGEYCDLAVEVVKKWDEMSTVDLHVTDYTTNTGLFLYEDPDVDEVSGFSTTKWQGPYGQVTLHVRLWEPHASWARNLHPGDMVYLRNVHIKMTSLTHLEGALHEDQKYPEKLQISKLTDRGLITEHERRKKAYYQQREKEAEARLNPGQPKKASAKASAKKKEEKKERQRLKKQQERAEAERKAEEAEKSKAGLNKHGKRSLLSA